MQAVANTAAKTRFMVVTPYLAPPLDVFHVIIPAQ
jgi:hypothetical protein